MPLGPTKCCCEMISSMLVGLILEAKGSVITIFTPFCTILTEKMLEWYYILFELSEVML